MLFTILLTKKLEVNFKLWFYYVKKIMKAAKVILIVCVCASIMLNKNTIINVNAIESEDSQIVTKTIYYNAIVQSNGIEPRASSTYTRHNVETFSQTVRGLKMSANVTLKATIRVNENTGVITSYDGPYLNQNWVEVGAYQGRITDVSTSAELSSSRRSLYCQGSFKIYAESGVGANPHYTSSFTIYLTAQ